MSLIMDYLVSGGDELALAKAQLEHMSGYLGAELAENEKLRAALVAMRDRDDRNGNLPPAYRKIIDDALGLEQKARDGAQT